MNINFNDLEFQEFGVDRYKCRGYTPLMWLILNSHISDDFVREIEMIVTQHPEELRKKNDLGYTPIALACELPDKELSAKLVSYMFSHVHAASNVVEGLKEDVSNRNRISSLLISIRNNNAKNVKTILDYYPDCKYNKCKNGSTPLITAVKNSNIEIIKLLLSHSFNVNETDVFGFGPIHHAVKTNRIDVVKLLLRPNYNLDINAKNKHGLTIFDARMTPEMRDILKSHGANSGDGIIFGMNRLLERLC